MKEKLKNELPMLVGILIAMYIIDVISNDSFELIQTILRIIVTLAVYITFRFIHFKVKKRKQIDKSK
ncbi:MAG: hypothetical protein IKJ01_01725 [Lachnospiraceae bacterium]|nr:hypothetical protein [Lachnospiraceae bacterium]